MVFTMISCLFFLLYTAGIDSKRHFPWLSFLLAHAFAFPAASPQRGTASVLYPLRVAAHLEVKVTLLGSVPRACTALVNNAQLYPTEIKGREGWGMSRSRPAAVSRSSLGAALQAHPGSWHPDFLLGSGSSVSKVCFSFFQVGAHFLSVPVTALSK